MGGRFGGGVWGLFGWLPVGVGLWELYLGVRCCSVCLDSGGFLVLIVWGVYVILCRIGGLFSMGGIVWSFVF